MILKVKHSKNFTVIPNQIFTDLNDALAIGILAFMLSKPSDWEVNKTFCYKHFKQGRTSIDNAFKSLQAAGYVYKTLEHKESGKFSGWVWVVSDVPQRNTENRQPLNRQSENRPSENVQQLSTVIPNTIEINKDNSNTKASAFDFDLLLEFINKYTGRKFKVINSSVRKSFNRRLKEGYTKDLIQSAIINASKSEYHIETKARYLTPEFFSRANTIDKYGTEVNEQAKKPKENKPYIAAG